MRNPYWNGDISLTDKATCPGDVFARIFEPSFDGKTTVLKEVGKRNVQEEMDAYAPYTDISYMLNCLKVGDKSVLAQSQPIYGDFSGLSSNPADVINTVRNAETAFGSLTASQRASYGNDWRVWFTEMLQDGSNPISSVDSVVSDPVVSDTESVKE